LREVKPLKQVISDLEQSKQVDAADWLEILAEDNDALIKALESIFETGLPRNRQWAEEVVAKAKVGPVWD